jgi:desulfoferrodoxin (superoxide reductase-like protein)
MELDHWITTMYARDIDTGRVFYLKEFHPTELAPMTDRGASIEAPLPPGVLRVAVFSFCNKHELWWSGVIDLS